MPSKRTYPVAEVARTLRRRTAVVSQASPLQIKGKSARAAKLERVGPLAHLAAQFAYSDEPEIKVEVDDVVKREVGGSTNGFAKTEELTADTFIAQMDAMGTETDETQVKQETDDIQVKQEVEETQVKQETDEMQGKQTIAVKQEINSTLQENTTAKIKAEINASPARVSKRSGLPTNWFPSVSQTDVLASHPKNWDKIYNSVVDMRKLIVTPVDSMGCERMPDTITPQLSQNDAKLYRFQLLISLMLSAQTKDETNYSAMVRLTTHFKEQGFPSLCLDACLAASEAEIDECIKQVGFHRRKATFIKKTCELIRANFNGDIPKTIEEIVTFPGVGPKMGHLLLQNGWGVNLGIGIDVHLHRLAQMWGWAPKSDKPENTRIALEGWLPKKYWADINPLLVGFGQTVCAPRALNCDICTLATAGLCKGVNRKLARTDLTDARVAKLLKLRGDLTKLIERKREESKM